MNELKDFTLIGVDVGGTTICVGLIKGNQILEYREVPTESFRSANDILVSVVDLISQVVKDDTIGIGIGVPGLVDVSTGVIFNINNIPSWRNFPLRLELSKYFNLPIYINNDANCFALGEYFFGKGRGVESLVAITLGTGVGAGIVVNGKLHTGILGCAGEIGGLPYEDSDFESYCSSKFFDRVCGVSGEALYGLAFNGDKIAQSQFQQFGLHLGKLLKSVLFVLAPKRIVLGGSISKGSSFFVDALMNEINLFPYKPILEQSSIVISELGNSALLGAAALVLDGRD